MARPHKIWFREGTGWWMVKVAGVQHKLAKGYENRAEADQKFHELMLATAKAPECADSRTADVIESFLQWSRVHLAEDTHRINKYYCQLFAEACGKVPSRQLRPFHVSRWVDAKVAAGDWGETTVYNAKRCAFRVFSWATQEGILAENPLVGMKRPQPPPRQRAIQPEEFHKMYDYAGGPFRDFLQALYLTGARPKELRTLKWKQVHEDRLILGEHKTRKKTGKLRVVMLDATMQAMMGRLRAQATGEHVFLNTEGLPWTMNAVRLQVMRLKKKLGLSSDVCAYLCRHGFGTRAILNGVDPATLQELMGHSSMEMISKVYVHLADQHQHLRDAVEKVNQTSAMPSTDDSRPARKRARPLEKKTEGQGNQPPSA